MFLEITGNFQLWKFFHVEYQRNMFIFQKQVKIDPPLIRFTKISILDSKMSGVTRNNLEPWLAKGGNFIISSVKQR